MIDCVFLLLIFFFGCGRWPALRIGTAGAHGTHAPTMACRTLTVRAATAACFVLLLAAGCGRSRDGHDPASASIEDLRHPNAVRRMQAVKRVGQVRSREAVQPLFRVLGDVRMEIRQRIEPRQAEFR